MPPEESPCRRRERSRSPTAVPPSRAPPRPVLPRRRRLRRLRHWRSPRPASPLPARRKMPPPPRSLPVSPRPACPLSARREMPPPPCPLLPVSPRPVSPLPARREMPPPPCPLLPVSLRPASPLRARREVPPPPCPLLAGFAASCVSVAGKAGDAAVSLSAAERDFRVRRRRLGRAIDASAPASAAGASGAPSAAACVSLPVSVRVAVSPLRDRRRLPRRPRRRRCEVPPFAASPDSPGERVSASSVTSLFSPVSAASAALSVSRLRRRGCFFESSAGAASAVLPRRRFRVLRLQCLDPAIRRRFGIVGPRWQPGGRSASRYRRARCACC